MTPTDRTQQNFENHSRIIVGYHVVLTAAAFLALGGALYYLATSSDGPTRFLAALVILTNVGVVLTGWYARVFALRAQDRVILLEENLRRLDRIGERLDPRLTVRQIIGLRFAPDDEWEALARRAVEENLSEKDIKRAIVNWRTDEYRV